MEGVSAPSRASRTALWIVLAYGLASLATWVLAPLVLPPGHLSLSRPLSAVLLVALAATALRSGRRGPGAIEGSVLAAVLLVSVVSTAIDTTRPGEPALWVGNPWTHYLGDGRLWTSAWVALPLALVAAMLLVVHARPRLGGALAGLALVISYASVIGWAAGGSATTSLPEGVGTFVGTQIALMTLAVAASRAGDAPRTFTGGAPDPRTARRWDLLLLAAAVLPVAVVLLVNLASRIAPDLGEVNSVIGLLLGVSLMLAVRFYVRADRQSREHERRAIEEAERQALHDPLTGLANRTLAVETIALAMARARRTGTTVTVLFCDLDGLKQVNDTHGHVVGDTLIRQTGARLENAVREEDVVARIGGDEFLVVTEHLGNLGEMSAFADRVLASAAQPLPVDGLVLEPAISVGIAAAEPGEAPLDVIRNADTAMYRAKVNGRGRWELFDRAMRTELADRRRLGAELRHAVADGAMTVHLQPIVRIQDRSVVGYEALARWRHPQRGVLEPRAWLDVADETRQIIHVGRHVIRTTIAWLADGGSDVRFATVNVSARQLAQDDVAGFCIEQADAYGVSPERLALEVCEEALTAGGKPAYGQLERLASAHFGLFVDRFGAGTDALAPWRHLPVSGMKLDGSVVRHLEGAQSARVAAGGAGLVSGLRIIGVATGVETYEQAEHLLRLGWEFGQGNLFGRPEPMAPMPPSLTRLA